MNWGYDIAGLILKWTGMASVIVQINDLDSGIQAELVEVIVSQKMPKEPAP